MSTAALPRSALTHAVAQAFLTRDSPNYFDLENPLQEQRLAQLSDTRSRLRGLVVIDHSDASGQYRLLSRAGELAD